MAIIRKAQETTTEKLSLEINNGDFKALQAIKTKMNLADEEAVLRFALAVLTQSKTDTLYIDDDTGARVGLQPSDSLRKKSDDKQPTN